MDWLLGPSPASMLRERAENHQAILKALETIDLSALKIQGYIGYGYSGSVVEVKYQERTAALKLYSSEKPRPYFVDVWENEITNAIVLQQLLGELGVAPKVLGVISIEPLQKFIQSHSSEFDTVLAPMRADTTFNNKGPVRYAMLMEYVGGTTSKDVYKPLSERPQRLNITKQQKDDILRQAKNIDQILYKHRIRGDDFDVVLTKDFRLLLIDLGFFEVGKRPVPRGVESVTRAMLENGNIILVEGDRRNEKSQP